MNVKNQELISKLRIKSRRVRLAVVTERLAIVDGSQSTASTGIYTRAKIGKNNKK